MQLKDYLHLYIGCDCETPDGIMVLSAIDIHNTWSVWFNYKHTGLNEFCPAKNYEILSKLMLCGKGYRYNQVKPILRGFADMTEQEMERLWITVEKLKNLQDGEALSESDSIRYKINSHEATRYLLSIHIDIFGLIPAGLAIHKSKVKEVIKESYSFIINPADKFYPDNKTNSHAIPLGKFTDSNGVRYDLGCFNTSKNIRPYWYDATVCSPDAEYTRGSLDKDSLAESTNEWEHEVVRRAKLLNIIPNDY